MTQRGQSLLCHFFWNDTEGTVPFGTFGVVGVEVIVTECGYGTYFEEVERYGQAVIGAGRTHVGDVVAK